jgi:hypothetical protein
MHTVDLLEQALALAASLGVRVRQEWLGGSGGGSCEIRGQRWLFIDLALTPAEQFAQVSEALTAHPGRFGRAGEASSGVDGAPQSAPDNAVSIPISVELYRALELKKSA